MEDRRQENKRLIEDIKEVFLMASQSDKKEFSGLLMDLKVSLTRFETKLDEHTKQNVESFTLVKESFEKVTKRQDIANGRTTTLESEISNMKTADAVQNAGIAPIRLVVFGAVGIILSAVLSAMINKVL